MRFTIRKIGDYLRADLHGRETAEETKKFLDALNAAAVKHACRKALISNHRSHAIFRVESFALSAYFRRLASLPGHRVALVADNAAVRAAQQYVETLARQQRLEVRAFPTEEDAIVWLGAATESAS